MKPNEGRMAVPKVARWPHAVGLAACVLAAVGLAFAPISGIVYFIALPGLALSAYWALARRSPARAVLAASVGLVVCGLVAGVVGLSLASDTAVARGSSAETVVEQVAFAILIVVPLIVLLLGTTGTAVALRHPGRAS